MGGGPTGVTKWEVTSWLQWLVSTPNHDFFMEKRPRCSQCLIGIEATSLLFAGDLSTPSKVEHWHAFKCFAAGFWVIVPSQRRVGCFLQVSEENFHHSEKGGGGGLWLTGQQEQCYSHCAGLIGESPMVLSCVVVTQKNADSINLKGLMFRCNKVHLNRHFIWKLDGHEA